MLVFNLATDYWDKVLGLRLVPALVLALEFILVR